VLVWSILLQVNLFAGVIFSIMNVLQKLLPPVNVQFHIVTKFSKLLTMLSIFIAVFSVITAISSIIILTKPSDIAIESTILRLPGSLGVAASLASIICAGFGFFGIRRDNKVLVITYFVMLMVALVLDTVASFYIFPYVMAVGAFAGIAAILISTSGICSVLSIALVSVNLCCADGAGANYHEIPPPSPLDGTDPVHKVYTEFCAKNINLDTTTLLDQLTIYGVITYQENDYIRTRTQDIQKKR